KTPYVVMKYATTLDGKIACYNGKSRFVTGEAARKHVQILRNRYMGIMVGVGTVLADNPSLECHMEGGRNPVRIICDTSLRTPIDSYVCESAGIVRTIIATCETDENKLKPYLDKNVEIIYVSKDPENHIDLKELMDKLGELKIDSILLEGGGTLNASALKAGIVNYVYAYVAPKIFGGENAPSPVRGVGVSSPDEAYIIENKKMELIGDDILVMGNIKSV
nr:RibD family protein [Lachnospiraceae bacterium]